MAARERKRGLPGNQWRRSPPHPPPFKRTALLLRGVNRAEARSRRSRFLSARAAAQAMVNRPGALQYTDCVYLAVRTLNSFLCP